MAKEKKELIVGVNGDLSDNFTTGQKAVLGLQNTLAMCGVILVPILCGLDVSVTLFCAGIGTIIYQFIDKKMVPAFLGGSFAIIAGVSTVVGEMGIPYAQGGILGMAVFYLLFALLLKILGKDRVARVFPPIIVGPIIMVLGLSLASVGVQEAEANWPIAIITFLIAVGVNNFSKGLTRVMTIIIALVGGFIISIPFGLVDFTALKEAAWIGVPSFTLPQFSWKAIALIAPCAIVPCLEHIGDVMAVGTVVGKDFTHEPGLDRSVFACGVSTVLSGCLGGPSLTIHSENTGVLAVTHLYSPTIVRFGALWMALLAFCPKFNALCGSIPQAVLGGVGILLYGMVTSTGIRWLTTMSTSLSPATCASRLLSSSWVSAALPSASAPSPSAAWLSPPSPASSCTSCCPAVRRSKQFSTHPLLYTVSGSARYPGTAAESTFLQPARFLPRCPSSSLCRGKNARRATALRAV